MDYEIIVATKNKDKMREFRHYLSGYTVSLQSLLDIDLSPKICETGSTFLDNALIKAKAVARHVNKPVLADDSGLQIAALNDFPGTKSARFMIGSSYPEKMDAIIKMMETHNNRSAQFSCTLVLITPDGDQRFFIGTATGQITEYQRGINGFGFDPIFFCDELNKSFAEASIEEKRIYSHRGRAVEKLIECLINRNLIEKTNPR
jgi:XTP/dITP diphosphohydrolase